MLAQAARERKGAEIAASWPHPFDVAVSTGVVAGGGGDAEHLCLVGQQPVLDVGLRGTLVEAGGLVGLGLRGGQEVWSEGRSVQSSLFV